MRKTQYAWMALGGLICLFGLALVCKLRDGNRAVAQPELLPPLLDSSEPQKSEKTNPPARKDKPAVPKATLEMPSPSEPPPILPVSFGSNTPTPPEPVNRKKSDPLLSPAPKPPPPPSPPLSQGEKKSETAIPSWNTPGNVKPASAASSAEPPLARGEIEPITPLPALRPKPPAAKAKVVPLTGTYPCRLDDKGRLTLPRALREQLSGSDIVLLSPGPDKCLWLTNPPHLERLGERLDQSQAREADVRVFKRLYFAQTERLPIHDDGRVTIPERLGQFAELHREVVLVGIDDHFEVWDAARWRSYTQQKSADPSAALAEQE